MVEINALGYLSSSNGQQHSPTTIIASLTSFVNLNESKLIQKLTHPTVVFQGYACFIGIRCFDEDEFVLPHLVENALAWTKLKSVNIFVQCYIPYRSKPQR